MVRCAVRGCTNYQGKRCTEKQLKYFSFPKDPILYKQWIKACGSDRFNCRIARVCSDHFTEQDWKLEHLLLNVSDDKKRLKQGAVPTQRLPHSSPTQPDEVINTQPDEVINTQPDEVIKKQKQLVEQAVASYDEGQVVGISSCFFQAEVAPPLSTTSELEQQLVDYCFSDEMSTFHSTELQNQKLENRKLRLEAIRLQQRVRKAEAVVSEMSKIFTKGQIKRLKNPTKNCNWHYEDVSNSISLFTSGPVLYQMLWKKKYPLPSPSTLRKWAAALKLRPGVIISTLKALKRCTYNQTNRLCILSFYEIRLKANHNDEIGDTGLRPYKYAQVFMVRGLMDDWKKILYYNFDCMLPALILKDMIRTLRDINFTVVAVVSGVGPRKLAFWKNLKIDECHPYFEVFEGQKVFYFANVPHLIKRLRNHFLRTGFLLYGKPINVDPLREMLEVEPAELTIRHDLTEAHINSNRVGRHNLRVALQLFSQSVADALRKCVSMGKMYSQNALECSDFIEIVDEWFGVFNSKAKAEGDSEKPVAYGLELEEQNLTLDAMSDIVRNLKVVGDDDESLVPFQKGVLLNNCGLLEFYEYIKEKYSIACFYTNNLNPDDLEHTFGLRKSYRGVAYQPTPLEFKYRLRAGILINLHIDN